MTVHVFPSGREVANVRMPGRDAALERADRIELCLVAALIATTAAQALLCVWSWLG